MREIWEEPTTNKERGENEMDVTLGSWEYKTPMRG